MIMSSRGKRLWIVDETGQTQPVGSYGDITGKPRGGHLPDWWVEEKDPDWTPPAPTSLLSMTAANVGHVESRAAGGAGGMKIGAGHKPQPYDDHGRYTGPTGASISMDGGTIRMFSADAEEPEEWQVDEPEGGQGDGQEESAQDAEQRVEEMARELQRAADELEAARQQAQGANKPLEGVQVADSGQVKSDAGGLSNEERRLEEKKFTPERLVQSAKADIGSDKWAPKVVGGEEKNQCNVFVAEKLRETGAHVPNVGGKAGTFGEGPSDYLAEKTGGAIGGQVPSANDWHKGVPGYERVNTENGEKPMPGDVAASKEHVGIVSDNAKTISVTAIPPASGHVVENDWGFRANQKPVTFWRYKGTIHN